MDYVARLSMRRDCLNIIVILSGLIVYNYEAMIKNQMIIKFKLFIVKS